VSEQQEALTSEPMTKASPYAWYVLFVLVLVYIMNFVDRSILSILANDIKHDLGLSDADLGFLYGTAFGVFYALFGLPLGKLADSWNRTRLLTLGLGLWSMMTALSGFSKTGGMLAGARIGVGIGEATASPSAYSLISDWFPKAQRATALAIYSSGLFIGGAISLVIGGQIAVRWNAAVAAGTAPFALAGWQAAFIIVGIPGLLLALWVSTLREPVRGQADGLLTSPSPTPFADFFAELVTIVPPLTLLPALRRGPAALLTNMGVAALILLIVWGLIRATGDAAQWAAVGFGFYAIFSWASTLRHRDPPTFALIWKTPAFLCTALGYGLVSFQAYAIGFWAAPYAERAFGVSKIDAGRFIGIPGAFAGLFGAVLGGYLADKLRKRMPAGRVLMIAVPPLLAIVPVIMAFHTTSATTFFVLLFTCTTCTNAALGGAAATTQDLVLPRMRGVATATFFIATTLIGLSFGPYMAGYVSKVTGDLATGVLSVLAVAPISLLLLIIAYRALPDAESSMLDRARAAGEAV
jgi:MFS family permease